MQRRDESKPPPSMRPLIRINMAFVRVWDNALIDILCTRLMVGPPYLLPSFPVTTHEHQPIERSSALEYLVHRRIHRQLANGTVRFARPPR